MNKPDITNKTVSKPRILSIDALRGFDMIWILGAEGVFASLYILYELPILSTLAKQMQHTQWHGITAYDIIFPLFIFLSGISIGLSAKPISGYQVKQQRLLKSKAYKRLLILCVLGIVYNHGWGGGIPASFDDVRYVSVLGRIAIAGFVATWCVWYLSEKAMWYVAIGILVGYWVLLEFITIGPFGDGNFTPGHSLNAWFDINLLPGIRYQNLAIDPEGLLSNIPSIVNALLGVFTGKYIKKYSDKPNFLLKSLIYFSLVCLVLGYCWGIIFPINKTLWTSSFVLVTVGYSLMLLVLFYWLIDILKLQHFGKFFAVIGVNSIIIYLMTSLIHWRYTVESTLGGFISSFDGEYQNLFYILAVVIIQWLFLYWLYKRNIFIKV